MRTTSSALSKLRKKRSIGRKRRATLLLSLASLKAVDPTVKTIALTFKVKGRAFASIASVSLKTVNPNLLERYRDEKEFGILCTEQKRSRNVVSLDPLWIWHE